MAEAPGGGAGAKQDPQALIDKHAAVTQSGAAGDAAIVARVESSIKNSPMGWLQGMLGEVGSRASAEQGEVKGKLAEHEQLVSTNQKDAPKDAGPPPPPGPAAHPAVPAPAAAAAKGGPVAQQSAAGGPAAAVAHVPAHPVTKGGPAQHPAAAPAPTIAGAIAGASNDAQLDGILNAYTPKSPQTTQTMGRIKQMGDIANGFNGQLDVYVSQGGAIDSTIAASANFLGVGKDANAIWRNNPYRKVHGILGGIMTGMSAVKSVCSIVGSICGKLGLVLTVIGLLGMIFPPIGAAVSGIARILSVVGMICDAISFVLSGILTGLNGVVLAQQIAAGASAEEKAATADLMMSEANEAASGFVNMAMVFGPKFMKGLMGSSKGIVASLMKQAKATIGRISLKVSANVSHFANKIVRKLGFGGSGFSRVGGAWKDTGFIAGMKEKVGNTAIGRAFNGAPKHLESIQEKLMAKYGNTTWAKNMDRVGAWGGSVAHRFDIEDKVGKLGEKSGKWVGGLGADTKLGKSLAASAERSELQTRELAMKMSARDASHLEEQRWRNELNRRQAANPDHVRSADAENKFVAGQGQKVREQHNADFEKAERQREAKEKLETMRTERFDRRNDEFYENKRNGFTGTNARDSMMDTVHNSRAKRYQLEEQFRAQETERKELLGKATRSAEEQTRLTNLNSELKSLDEARRLNKMHETDLSGLASGAERVRAPEYNNWKDVTSNAWEVTAPMLEMMHLKEQDSAWELAEKANLKKQVKFDKGKAKANAAGRGGQSTFEDIANDARDRQMEELTAFVRAQPQAATVTGNVRSMLSGVVARPQQAPQVQAPAPQAQTQTPAPSPQQGGVSVTPAPAPQGEHPAGVGNAVSETVVATAQVHEPAPTGPVPQESKEPDEGGAGEALPYWPSLLPEFDQASKDFGWMRKVAVEFKKAQIEGKQKAVDTLAVYGRYKEYAQLRAAAAKKNAAGAQQTQGQTQQNVAHAQGTEGQASQGEAKQGEAKGAASNKAATDLPEPESRGFWGRILGAVKRWAKNKAAQVFGWIQEKIASVVLKGLCGVSMGDMRDYAGALRRQQQAAHGVAGDAAQKSNQADQTSIKLGSDATKEAQAAADSIGECDKNITDADQFMADITSFEGQLAEEKAHAQMFIAQVQQAAHAEQAKRKAEEAARAAEEQKERERAAALGQQPQGAQATAVAPAPAPAPTATPQQEEKAPHEEDPNLAADTTAIHSASDYVASQSEVLASRLEARADDYQNQLALALTNRTGKGQDGVDLKGPAKKESKHIVEEFKEAATHTKADMEAFHSIAIEPSHARQIAEQIINSAQHLEQSYTQSEDALDELFARTYNGIKDGRRTLKSRLFDGDNAVGHLNEQGNQLDNHVIDSALPQMNTAWNAASAPIQVPAAPAVAPAAAPVQRKATGDAPAADGESHASIAAEGVAGATGQLPHLDAIQKAFGKHDVTGVKAQVGGPAAQAASKLGAHAYATGNTIAFASSPSLHTAAHEAAHVVQQRAGVSLKAIDEGSSDTHEVHADEVADAVVAGKSAELLLDKLAGSKSSPKVQRQQKPVEAAPGAADKKADIKLNDGENFRVTPDGLIIYRVSWLKSDPNFSTDGKEAHCSTRIADILRALKVKGVLYWISDAEITSIASNLIIGNFDANAEFARGGVAFNAYVRVGPPPNVEVIFQRDKNQIQAIVRQEVVVPGPVVATEKVTLSPAVRQKILAGLEAYTQMPIDAARKAGVVAKGDPAFTNRTVAPDQHGVAVTLSHELCEELYTKQRWDAYVSTPEKKGKGGGLGGQGFDNGISDEDREYALKWLKQIEAKTGAKQGPSMVISKEMIAKMKEIDADPKREEILAALRGDNKKKDPQGKESDAIPKTLSLQALENAIDQVHTKDAEKALGLPEPETTRKPLFDEIVTGNIINRSGALYVGKESQFYFETTNGRDAFAIPDLVVRWVVTKQGQTTPIAQDTTHSIDISTNTPDYFEFDPKDTGIYTVHAFVSHSFYRSTHKQIDIEVKTEAARTKELNDPAFKGLEGKTTSRTEDHEFDVTGDKKQSYGAMTTGTLPDDFQRKSFEDRVGFIENDKKSLQDMIDAHKDSKDPRWVDAVAYAQHKLDQLNNAKTDLTNEKDGGAVFFEARGTYLSRKPGIDDKALKLVANAKKENGTITIVIHDYSQVYEPEDHKYTGSGTTFDAALEAVFVTMTKTYPPGRISALFEKLDNDMKPLKETKGFELDTGTLWKDIKGVVWNDKVQLGLNILGAATMVFFPLSAPVIFPLLAVYNSAAEIDHMSELRDKGMLGTSEVAKGVAMIGLNFVPYLGELKSVQALGKAGVFMLDGVVIGGNAVVMSAEAVHQLKTMRDADIGPIAKLDADIRELKGRNKSDPKLPGMEADLQRMITQAQNRSTEVVQGLALNVGIMLVQTAALKGLTEHVQAKNIKQLKAEGIFKPTPGVEPHYDPVSGRIVGDETKLDPGKLAKLKQTWAQDQAGKRSELQQVLGSDKVEVERGGSKPKVEKVGDGYKVTIPEEMPFQAGIDEAKKVAAAAEKPVAPKPVKPGEKPAAKPEKVTDANVVAETTKADPELAAEPTTSQAKETTAAAVPGSTFKGGTHPADPQAVHDAAKAAFEGTAKKFKGVKNVERCESVTTASKDEKARIADTFLVTMDDGTTFTVRVTSGPIGGDAVARTVVNTTKEGASFVQRPGTPDLTKVEVKGRYVVQLNETVDPANAERGIAHEVGEILAERELAAAKQPVGPDVLKPGVPPKAGAKLSPHDMGRLGEIKVLASKVNAGDKAALREMNALIEELGLREGVGAGERRKMVKEALADDPAAWKAIETASKPEATLDADQKAQLEDVRKQRQLDIAANEDKAAKTKPVHETPDAKTDVEKVGDKVEPGKKVSQEQLDKLAAQAEKARKAKSKQTCDKLRQSAAANGGVAKVGDVQCGGGAALAARDKNALLVDARGRWQQDASAKLAQTANQLRGLKDAGIGDPFQFAEPNERVPMEAVKYWQDQIAAQGDVIDGEIVHLAVDDSGRTVMTIQPADGSAPIKAEIDGKFMMATGFPPERIPGTPRGQTPDKALDQIKAALKELTTDPTHKAQAQAALGEIDKLSGLEMKPGQREQDLAAARKSLKAHGLEDAVKGKAGDAVEMMVAGDNWNTLKKQHPEKMVLGDAANLKSLDPKATDKWIVGGPGGTGISAVEIILDGNPAAHVTMVGKEPPAGIIENDQFVQVLRKHADAQTCALLEKHGLKIPPGDGRFSLVLGVDIAPPSVDAGGNVRVNGKVDGKPMAPDFVPDGYTAANNPLNGGGYVSSIGREAQLPPIAASFVDAVEAKGGSVNMKPMYSDDGHYLGYELLAKDKTGKQTSKLDVTGAASRFPPWEMLADRATEGTERARFAKASDLDAPPEGGNFDGGFVSSATQASRYAKEQQKTP